MSEPVRNFNRPTTDGRLALENRDLYVAQSAATKDGNVPPIPPRDRLQALGVEAMFAQQFGGAQR